MKTILILLMAVICSCVKTPKFRPPFSAQRQAPTIKTATLELEGGSVNIPRSIFDVILRQVENERVNGVNWSKRPDDILIQSIDYIIKYDGKNLVLSSGGLIVGRNGTWTILKTPQIKSVYEKAVAHSRANSESLLQGGVGVAPSDFIDKHPF